VVDFIAELMSEPPILSNDTMLFFAKKACH